jgi:hypothetical protein
MRRFDGGDLRVMDVQVADYLNSGKQETPSL